MPIREVRKVQKPKLSDTQIKTKRTLVSIANNQEKEEKEMLRIKKSNRPATIINKSNQIKRKEERKNDGNDETDSVDEDIDDNVND